MPIFPHVFHVLFGLPVGLEEPHELACFRVLNVYVRHSDLPDLPIMQAVRRDDHIVVNAARFGKFRLVFV